MFASIREPRRCQLFGSLVGAWRTLFNAAAEVIWLVGRRPGGFDPPGSPCLGEGTYDGGRLPRVFTRRLTLPYDVEGAVLFSVLPDVVLDLGDGLGCNARRFGAPADRGREHPVVTQRPPHRLPARPRSDHPYGDAWLLDRRWQEGHLLEPVVLARIGKRLPTPQPGEYLQTLVEKLCPNLPVGRFPHLRETTVVQGSKSYRQDEAPFGQMVEGHRLTGQLPRSPPSRRRQHSPDPHPLCAHRHRSHHDPRVVRVHATDTDAVPVKSAVPTRLLYLTGELRDGKGITRRDHEPVTQAYLLSPMPGSHTANEYTDPRMLSNHRTQHTAEKYFPSLFTDTHMGYTMISIQAYRKDVRSRGRVPGGFPGQQVPDLTRQRPRRRSQAPRSLKRCWEASFPTPRPQLIP